MSPVEVAPRIQVSSACDAWLPELHEVKSWQSPRTKCPTDITVVTQLSVDRFDMLHRLCSTWDGWVSAAVYLPEDHTPANLHAAVLELDAYHAWLEQSNGCKLDMMLYIPQGRPEPNRPPMHPLNALRNKALATAQTEVLLLLDVDFMISSSLNLLQHAAWIHDTVSAGVLVVLPALEPVNSDEAGQQAVIRTCTGGKADAIEGIGNGTLQTFHVDRFEPGHRATNTSRWVSSQHVYDVHYNQGYEPYVLVSKNLVPWYDERFTGYLEDKILHIQNMVSMGFSFAVHPEAFVVHYPHPNSKDQQLVKSTSLFDEITALGDATRAEIQQGTYLPPTKFAPCHEPYQTPSSTGTVPRDACSSHIGIHTGP